jgi:hypothetical protein
LAAVGVRYLHGPPRLKRGRYADEIRKAVKEYMTLHTTRLMTAVLVGTLLTYHGALAQQGGVHDRLPGMPDARARYVIYLHGRIIEDQGRRPTHPTWGTYEYQQILDRLAAGGLIVVSEQRPPMTDMGVAPIPASSWAFRRPGSGSR